MNDSATVRSVECAFFECLDGVVQERFHAEMIKFLLANGAEFYKPAPFPPPVNQAKFVACADKSTSPTRKRGKCFVPALARRACSTSLDGGESEVITSRGVTLDTFNGTGPSRTSHCCRARRQYPSVNVAPNSSIDERLHRQKWLKIPLLHIALSPSIRQHAASVPHLLAVELSVWRHSDRRHSQQAKG